MGQEPKSILDSLDIASMEFPEEPVEESVPDSVVQAKPDVVVKEDVPSVSKSKKPAVKRTAKEQRRYLLERDRDKGQYSVIRNIPKVMLTEILREFPDALNQTDALVAYTYCHADDNMSAKMKVYLTDAQKELVEGWSGSTYGTLIKKMDTVLPKLDRMTTTLNALEVLISYIIFDRLGFRNITPGKPDDVDLDEPGVVELLMEARSQCKKIQHDLAISNGRPLR